jgi:MAP kinase interacting serine/threonine kinase
VLGEGAYGSVYKCTHIITEIEYAVKIIYKSQGQVAKKVVREIEVYYQCQNAENILQLVELFEDENQFYLVFELIRGGSLEARIESMGDSGRLPETSVKSLVKSVAKALQFLHAKGIAHRDIKPANILLPNANSLEGAKLCDFDLASRSKTPEYRGGIW